MNTKAVRRSVWSFALRMEAVLAKHDATKGGQPNWRKDDIVDLLERVADEARELSDEVFRNPIIADAISHEAVDVANMALMVADKAVPLDTDDGSVVHGCTAAERELLDMLKSLDTKYKLPHAAGDAA